MVLMGDLTDYNRFFKATSVCCVPVDGLVIWNIFCDSPLNSIRTGCVAWRSRNILRDGIEEAWVVLAERGRSSWFLSVGTRV